MSNLWKSMLVALAFTTFSAQAQNIDNELTEMFRWGLDQRNSIFIEAFGLSGEKLKIYNETQEKYVNNHSCPK